MALTSFPVSLLLEARSVLLVGGGEVAVRKARLLKKSRCQLIVVDPDPISELVALATEVRGRRFAPTDLDGIAAVFVALEDGSEAADISLAARKRGIPVNVVDRGDLSTFIMPAIVDRDPIMIAISSGGASPMLVRRLRERLEAALEPGLGRFAKLLDQFRHAVKATRPDHGARRRFWEAALDGQIGRQFLSGDERGARDLLMHAVNDRSYEQGGAGSVVLVGAGPGDPDLLTLRALRALQDAEVVVHDALVDAAILDYIRRDARLIDVGRTKGRHPVSQADIIDILIKEARAGHRVVRLKGGDPFVFGRGGEEVEALRAARVPVEVVPGITAALGCGAAATIPLTHRGMAHAVTLVSGHGKDGAGGPDWGGLARLDHTLVVYMGKSAAAQIEAGLLAGGKDPATPVALIENGTRPDQVLAVGRLDRLASLAGELDLVSPTLLVIGEVVRLADPARIAAFAPDEPARLAATW